MFYKFIHIFWGADTKFTPNLVETINDSESGFIVSDHLFVTRFHSLYEYLINKGYPHIILDTSKDCLINKYAPQCKCLISHALPSNKEVLLSKRKYKKKTICRCWGGNNIIKPYTNRFWSDIRIFFNNLLTKYYFNIRYSRFAAIAIANIVDVVDIRKINKTIPLFRLGYGTRMISSELKELSNCSHQNNNVTNVLVGHRGTPDEHHLKVIESLQHFGSSIAIHLVLSYGDKLYINSLKNHITQKGYSNINIIESFLPIKEYYSFLNSIDVAIFDVERSSALGNISPLTKLKKKIYLNRRGVIKEAFDLEGVPYGIVDEISTQSFQEFATPADYSHCHESELYDPYDKATEWRIENLHKLFSFGESL